MLVSSQQLCLPPVEIFLSQFVYIFVFFFQFKWRVCGLVRCSLANWTVKTTTFEHYFLKQRKLLPWWICDIFSCDKRRVQIIKAGLPYCCHSNDCPPNAVKNSSPKSSWKLLWIWSVILMKIKHKVISVLHKTDIILHCHFVTKIILL